MRAPNCEVTPVDERGRAGDGVARALATFTPDELARWVIYVDQAERPPGTVTVAGTTLELEVPSVVGFIDELPGANWHHASEVFAVPTGGGVSLRRAAERPVSPGELAGWVVASRPPGCEDWMLLSVGAERESN